jgi:hypothetical protein
LVDAIDTHAHCIPRHTQREPGRNPLWPAIEVRGESAAARLDRMGGLPELAAVTAFPLETAGSLMMPGPDGAPMAQRG